MRIASVRIGPRYTDYMAEAITVRLDEADHVALRKEAERLGVRPGTLARMLLHAGLSGEIPEPRRSGAHDALDRLVRRSRRLPPSDAVELVRRARAEIGEDGDER